jgi:hypothetical protein
VRREHIEVNKDASNTLNRRPTDFQEVFDQGYSTAWRLSEENPQTAGLDRVSEICNDHVNFIQQKKTCRSEGAQVLTACL